jgi:hypothetical protein
VLWQWLVELYEVSFQESETSGWKIGVGLRFILRFILILLRALMVVLQSIIIV